MNRCMNNCYTFSGFWSLNKWIIRYMYVPLGGRRTQKYTMWLIFIFVGLWHDLILRWLAWALCNCVFFTLENLVISLFSSEKLIWLRKKPYFRYLIIAGGSINIMLLMLTNLAILHGFNNTPILLERAFFSREGFIAFLLSFVWLSCCVILMLELRENERRKNIFKKF